jgi:peptide subunit release factor 1 (eRF1)
MNKIDELVAKQDINPSDCLYHTNRRLKNKKMEPTGHIRVLALKKDSIARVEYTCPECRHAAYVETPWKKPFSIKCEKCGFLIRVPKMREEAKREMKAEQKAGKK